MKKILIGFVAVASLVLLMSITAFADTTCRVSGTKNYLALRSVPYTEASNEIAKLYEGDLFVEVFRTDNGFAYGYNRNGQYGFVNAKYITPMQPISPDAYQRNYTVGGTTNYLALRNIPSKEGAWEVERLYNGQTFRVIEFTTNGFAYGVSQNGNYGYVDAAYLR